jgi:hypothetical protein
MVYSRKLFFSPEKERGVGREGGRRERERQRERT